MKRESLKRVRERELGDRERRENGETKGKTTREKKVKGIRGD